MRRLSVLILALLTLSACSLGRGIDTSTDYTSNLVDGDYAVSSAHYDSRGYKKRLVLGIHHGILSDVDYTETNKSGENRDQLPESTVPWNRCEYSYRQIKPILYEQTILSQGEKVDAISGATRTCEDYRVLMRAGIKAARAGDPKEQTIDAFSDSYQATNEVDATTGSREEITVEYADGVLSSVTIRELASSPSHRALASTYATLAELSTQAKSLDPVTSVVDPNVLNRYNALLAEIRAQRE